MGLFSSSPARGQSSLLYRLVLVPLLALTTAGALAIAALMLYYSAIYPNPLSLRPKQTVPYVKILARDGAVVSEHGREDYVPIGMLPHYVADAVIATEDQRFYDHHGVDPFGMLRAAFINLREGRTVQGGSTLTQQLAKNLYLTSDRTFARKLEEFTLALWLEMKLSKEDILELYLNRVYLGSGAYGIDAAARRYFRKSARDLTLAEAAMIAGLLKAPSRYSPLSNPALARTRARLVLSQMEDVGSITEEQEHQAADEVARSFENSARAEAVGADYAVDYVMDQLGPAYLAGVAGGAEGLIVETTIDRTLQANASAVVEQVIALRGPELNASEAAAVVLDHDGALLALVGGRSYAETQFNRAVKGMRQPGSTFKPFVYLAALEAGYTPDSVVDDLPLSISGWAPRNDNGQYLGPMALRTALAKSVNSVAARLTLKLGAKRVAEAARRLGIKSALAKDATISLGTSEVSLLELTGAYNVIANGGRAAEPYVVRRVRSAKGEVLFTHPDGAPQPVVAPAQIAAMNDMLAATLSEGTGRRAAIPPYPAAGKTGTSQGFRDAWFIGYTAYLTAGVWVGNDDGTPMNHVVGGALPAEVWRSIMLGAHAGRKPLPLGVSSAATAVAGSAHPGERIGDDFFARATDDTPVSDTGSISKFLDGQ
ncbi:PBP1A family penicillin-binding protein [Hyphomicrobium sp. NDB2Meth4]|uniref:transglycosylase domain-containing protein n=1 Tax=Hyphomicrobium sp. NDB2Meth4 TaxID=1892846 RepID=UPI0009309ACD|nr:PBP1A family penicillin-binding protein [Hyphomicrobium sp. NDB2Meth4]